MTRETLDNSSLLVLRDLMTQLEVTWSFDHSAHPVHAVFEYSNPNQETAYRCSAAIVDDALRLTIQAFLSGEPSSQRLQALDELNAQWGMGRVYFDYGHKHFDLATGIYIGAGLPGPNLIKETLAHLIDSGQKIGRMQTPSFEPKLAIHPPVGVSEIHQILSEQGLNPTIRVDRELVGVRLAIPQVLDIVLELEVDPHQVLRVGVLETNPVGMMDEESAYRFLQNINRGISFGTMYFDRGNGRFVYSMNIPLAWFTFDANMARWLVKQASSVMLQLKREMA